MRQHDSADAFSRRVLLASGRQWAITSILTWAIALPISRLAGLQRVIEEEHVVTLVLWCVLGGLFGTSLLAGLFLAVRDTQRLAPRSRRIGWRIAIIFLPPVGHWTYWLFGPGRDAARA
jgi:hypothetical protein